MVLKRGKYCECKSCGGKIEEISKEFTNINKDLFRDYRDKELIKLLGKSKRFKNMKITDYINHKDIEKFKENTIE